MLDYWPGCFDKFIVEPIWSRRFEIWQVFDNTINLKKTKGVFKVLNFGALIVKQRRLNDEPFEFSNTQSLPKFLLEDFFLVLVNGEGFFIIGS